MLLATCALGTLSCGGGDANSSGGTGGSSGGQTPEMWPDLPPDIDQKMRALVDEVTRLTCERSQNCCAGFELRPRADCTGNATALLIAGVLGHIGRNDPKTYDFHYNEALAQVCLDQIRQLATQCTFGVSTDSTQSTMWQACTGVLLVNPKGETPLECLFDDQCVIDPAPGTHCVDQRCLPEIEVPVGARCFTDANAMAVPICRPLGTCNSGTAKCQARGLPGEPCILGSDEPCVDGYGCALGKCVPRLLDGQPCDGDGGCQLGAECRCDQIGCLTKTCLSPRGAGEPCAFVNQCTGGPSCDNGICKPKALGICELPPRAP